METLVTSDQLYNVVEEILLRTVSPGNNPDRHRVIGFLSTIYSLLHRLGVNKAKADLDQSFKEVSEVINKSDPEQMDWAKVTEKFGYVTRLKASLVADTTGGDK